MADDQTQLIFHSDHQIHLYSSHESETSLTTVSSATYNTDNSCAMPLQSLKT